MATLILLRHGESVYNAEGKFTGTTDVELTEKGKKQAISAGLRLKGKYTADAAFTSERIRARHTLELVLEELGTEVPVEVAHELNEQDFGDLEGTLKSRAVELYGEERVKEWRRAFEGYPPGGERFIAVQARVADYYRRAIQPQLRQGKNCLVVAHGNSLRALAVYLLDIGTGEIANFELGNAEPLILDFSEDLSKVRAYPV